MVVSSQGMPPRYVTLILGEKANFYNIKELWKRIILVFKYSK